MKGTMLAIRLLIGCLTVLGMTACQNNTEMLETSASAAPDETVVYHGMSYPKSELSQETLKWLEWYQALPQEMQLAISAEPHEFHRPYEAALETNAGNYKLTAPPQLQITDPLSSTTDHFVISSGNYEWSYAEHDEMISVTACGAHPLDAVMDNDEKLSDPDYNQLEPISYLISCDAMPDELVVKEWAIAALGNPGLEADSQTAYTDPGLIALKPDHIYEITAVWNSDKYGERGFHGQASYTLLTE